MKTNPLIPIGVVVCLGLVVMFPLVGTTFGWQQAVLLGLFLGAATMIGGGGWLWLRRVDTHSYLPNDDARLQNKDAVVVLTKSLLLTLTVLYAAVAAAQACFPANGNATGLVAAWAFAGLATGGAIGFLFGHPRIENNGTATDAKRKLKVQSSTSLDQINDWLTKAIVGVGLVEAKQILKFGYGLAKAIGEGLSGYCADHGGDCSAFNTGFALASAILLIFPMIGFVSSYLVTRTFITLALCRAEIAIVETGNPIDRAGVTPDQLVAAAESDRSVGFMASKDAPRPDAEVMRKLESLSLDELNDPIQIVAWAKAKIHAGEVAQAVLGFNKAVQLAPKDPGIALDYALAPLPGDTPEEKCRRLLKAYELVDATTSPALKAQIYNALTYRALYRTDSKGFEDAIKFGEEYVRNYSTDQSSGGILVNLACGYGQQLRELKKILNPTDDEKAAMKKARERALECARKAIELDERWKERLNLLWNPHHSLKLASPALKSEDDLEVFADDGEFRKLLAPLEQKAPEKSKSVRKKPRSKG